jgi:hypothetical protein
MINRWLENLGAEDVQIQDMIAGIPRDRPIGSQGHPASLPYYEILLWDTCFCSDFSSKQCDWSIRPPNGSLCIRIQVLDLEGEWTRKDAPAITQKYIRSVSLNGLKCDLLIHIILFQIRN